MNVVYLIVCVIVIEDNSSDDCDIDCGLGHQNIRHCIRQEVTESHITHTREMCSAEFSVCH